jgi:hypothetical protein
VKTWLASTLAIPAAVFVRPTPGQVTHTSPSAAMRIIAASAGASVSDPTSPSCRRMRDDDSEDDRGSPGRRVTRFRVHSGEPTQPSAPSPDIVQAAALMLSMTPQQIAMFQVAFPSAAAAAAAAAAAVPAAAAAAPEVMPPPPPPPPFDMETVRHAVIKDIEGDTGYKDLRDDLNFKYHAYIERILAKIAGNDRGALVCGGNTQSQKTGFKVVLYLIAQHLDFEIGTIIVTKGVAESQDLAAKIRGLLGERPAAEFVVSQSAAGQGVRSPDMLDILDKGGCVVSAHNVYQNKKNLKELRAYRGMSQEDGRQRCVVAPRLNSILLCTVRRAVVELHCCTCGHNCILTHPHASLPAVSSSWSLTRLTTMSGAK